MQTNSPDFPVPPRRALRFLRWFCHEHYLEEIEGDLEELFYEQAAQYSVRRAERWFWWQVLRTCRPYFWKKTNPKQYIIMQRAMFQNYFKTSYRNLWRNKTFSAINIFGLSLSMSVCLLIIMIISQQFKYDAYLTDSNRIYRVTTHVNEGQADAFKVATTTVAVAGVLQNEISGVSEVTRIHRYFFGEGYANGKEIPLTGKLADPSLFSLLQFTFAEGDARTAFSEANGIVLTYETAQKYFGDAPALGKPFLLKHLFQAPKEGPHEDAFVVTGVLAPTENLSHLDFEAILPFSFIETMVLQERMHVSILNAWDDTYQNYVYLKLEQGQTAEQVTELLNRVAEKHFAELEEEHRRPTHFVLQNVQTITPFWGQNYANQAGHAFPLLLLLFLGGISFIIMLSAIFNYTNLSVARAVTRAKEIGVRKVNGASKHQVRVQFIVEAVLLSTISLVFAVILLQFLSDAFAQIIPSDFFKIELDTSYLVYGWFILFALLLGIIAGIFPAFYIAKFNPIYTLKNFSSLQIGNKLTVRKVLTVVQFCISIVFISSALLLYQQFQYLLNVDLGLKGENILEANLHNNDYQLVTEAFAQFPEVESVASTSHVPGGGTIYTCQIYTLGKQDSLLISTMNITPNFLEQLSIQLKVGNNFQETVSNVNALRHVLLNEAAVEKLKFGSPSDAIGKQFITNDSITVEVIGVVKNFVNTSIQDPTRPMIILNNTDNLNYASLKINSNDYLETIKKLEKAWNAIDPIHPFSYRFFDEQIGEDFTIFKAIIKVVGFAGFLAIAIATIGFLGMVIFSTNGKLKEIAIRKVHGARIQGLFVLLSKNFVGLIGFSACIAIPLAYLLNSAWLQELPKRTELGWEVFAIAIGATLLIGVLVIIPQLWRVVISNPADTLRDE